MQCQYCGNQIPENATNCPACGAQSPQPPPMQLNNNGGQISIQNQMQQQANDEYAAWSTGTYIGLFVLSAIVPLVGWIYGGMNCKHQNRKAQAIGMIVISSIMFLIYLCD